MLDGKTEEEKEKEKTELTRKNRTDSEKTGERERNGQQKSQADLHARKKRMKACKRNNSNSSRDGKPLWRRIL